MKRRIKGNYRCGHATVKRGGRLEDDSCNNCKERRPTKNTRQKHLEEKWKMFCTWKKETTEYK